MHAFDPLRLTIDLHATGRDAREVGAMLNGHSGIALEFATARLGNLDKASPVDWLTTFAAAHVTFTRDLAEAYTAAARKLVK